MSLNEWLVASIGIPGGSVHIRYTLVSSEIFQQRFLLEDDDNDVYDDNTFACIEVVICDILKHYS